MAFTGYDFIFDGVPCSKYGLLLYDIGSNKQSDIISLTSAGKLITDNISKRPTSLLYGTEQNNPLTFNLVFTASPDRIDSNQPFDRFELEAISSWLSWHDTWKWLKIIQPDLEIVKYKCLITELQEITYSGLSWALGCTVTCDSPYAYMNQKEFEYIISTSPTEILFRNRSSYNGIYYPKIEITLGTARTIEINNTTNNKLFKLTDLPSGTTTISIDNDKQTITSNLGINIYPYFNFNWLGFVRGDNQLSVTGDCTIKFMCEFPVNVGA
jgi:hypothetical protein